MDADFEQHYQAAERAYGLGDYTEAHTLASALWDQLESAPDEHDPSLVLGWRAVVSLLLGHIQLHGLQQPEQAAISYERGLQGDVDATSHMFSLWEELAATRYSRDAAEL